MVTVPQYQREVKPEVTPTPYNHVQVNGDMFGVNVAQAYGKMGEAIQNTLHTAVDIKNRIDDTKMLEIYNEQSEWEQKNLYDKENGYFYKQGKDAFGKSKEVMENFDKDLQEKISKAGFTPANAARFNASFARMRNRIAAQVNAHDFQQGVKWSTAEAGLAMQNAITSGVNARNNDEEIATHLATGLQSIEWQGEIQQKDKAQIEMDKKEYISQFHEAVLSSYLAENSLKASQYLEKHKSEIRPDRLAGYIDAVGNNELMYTARTTASGLVGLPLEQAYAKINAIQNPKERAAVEREFSHLTAQQEVIENQKSQELMNNITNQLTDIINKGGDINQLKMDIMKTNLPFKDKQKQIEFINTCWQTGQEVNLWNVTETLDDMMVTDNENFKKINLDKYPLTKSQRDKYKQAQRETVNYTTEKELRTLVKNFSGVNSWGKDSLDNNAYKDDIVTMLSMLEHRLGKAFDVKHIDKDYMFSKFVEGFDYKKTDFTADETKKLKEMGVNKSNIDETKELYSRAVQGLQKKYNKEKAHAMVQSSVIESYMTFKKVNKREPDGREMYNMVRTIYNDVGRELQQKAVQKTNAVNNMYKTIYNTPVTKKGYTKELTYFENVVIPQMERETGIKMKVTSTYRPTGKYGHEKGIKIDLFPQNPTRDNILRTTEYLLAHPLVGIVFTSAPDAVGRYKGHGKFKDANKYDNSPEAKKNKIHHKTHFDVTLNSITGNSQRLY